MKPTPLEVLRSMENGVYSNEDGENCSIKLLPGMSPEEIAKVAAGMPGSRLSGDIIELLAYIQGIEYSWLDEIKFTHKHSAGTIVFSTNNFLMRRRPGKLMVSRH